jgi:hypothetical protein
MEPIRISYFSDVLCIWAYIAQIRLDELKANFPDQVEVNYHFFPVFGNAHEKLEKSWRDRGGLRGYSNHVHTVAAKFPHITVHPGLGREYTNLSHLLSSISKCNSTLRNQRADSQI